MHGEDAARQAASWLASVQRPDGSVPSSQVTSAPGWTTAHALLLWQGLGGCERMRHRAREWLLRTEGRRQTVEDGERGVAGHDVGLAGWPWVAGTHSWIEPTAMAIIALCAEGDRNHPRVVEGIRLIRDRAIRGGGWNYGNPAVFGRTLRPQPGPTGVALVALAAYGPVDDSIVAQARNYLLRSLPTIHSAISVGWGVLGLAAHQAYPSEADSWLEAAHERCREHRDSTVGLSLLLRAASGQSWTNGIGESRARPGIGAMRAEGIKR
jgi:hypothetical protein